MLYLLAAIGIVTVAVLLWRVLSPDRVGVGAHRNVVAPDDDPDFLRRLGEQTRRRDEGDGPPPGTDGR